MEPDVGMESLVRLAEDREILAEMGKSYLENDLSILSEDWALRCTEWLVL